MEPVRNSFEQDLQKCHGRGSIGPLVQLYEGELGGAVDHDKEIQLPLFGANLGNVDVKISDWICLKLPLRRFVAIEVWQMTDAMALGQSPYALFTLLYARGIASLLAVRLSAGRAVTRGEARPREPRAPSNPSADDKQKSRQASNTGIAEPLASPLAQSGTYHHRE